jgi:uncharacterized protein (TIGR02246 family)
MTSTERITLAEDRTPAAFLSSCTRRLALSLAIAAPALVPRRAGATSQEVSMQATPTTEDADEIRGLLAAYEQAVNSSDATAAVELYAPDGVFYPYNAPTAAGHEHLLATYEQIFSALRLSITFTIHEIGVDGDLAFATTSSAGEATVLAQNVTAPEENRELFTFTHTGGQWKIARYMFNKAAPPAA